MERNGWEELGPFNLSISGYNKEEDARKVGDNVGEIIRALSKFIDLSYLDGVTISYFYENALLSLDRGIETDTKLQPSSGEVVGVAMTPMVLRNGTVKSHIVLNAAFIEGILDNDLRGDAFQQALAIIAHECGHVSNCGALDRSFPGRALIIDILISMKIFVVNVGCQSLKSIVPQGLPAQLVLIITSYMKKRSLVALKNYTLIF